MIEYRVERQWTACGRCLACVDSPEILDTFRGLAVEAFVVVGELVVFAIWNNADARPHKIPRVPVPTTPQAHRSRYVMVNKRRVEYVKLDRRRAFRSIIVAIAVILAVTVITGRECRREIAGVRLRARLHEVVD